MTLSVTARGPGRVSVVAASLRRRCGGSQLSVTASVTASDVDDVDDRVSVTVSVNAFDERPSSVSCAQGCAQRRQLEASRVSVAVSVAAYDDEDDEDDELGRALVVGLLTTLRTTAISKCRSHRVESSYRAASRLILATWPLLPSAAGPVFFDLGRTGDYVATNVANYYVRKLAGTCTYSGCESLAADGFQLCEPHRDDQRGRGKQSMQAIRAGRRDAGLCAECGKSKSTTYRC
ncbi:MAG: hypothetical protein NT062_15625 [Proteobacteria bacterium]|nr:hypothetical protein [Pseudomonadota bacterium]